MHFAEISRDVLHTREKSPREEAVAELAGWWGDRLVTRASEVMSLPYYQKLKPSVNIHGWVALVAHHCHDKKAKEAIRELRGVIGAPYYYMVSYGKDAVDQINTALGHGSRGNYGKAHDGLTHVYLHPVPPESYETCVRLESAEHPSVLSAFAPRESMDPGQYRSTLEQLLSAPWEGLTVDLTEHPDELKKRLTATGLLRSLDLDTTRENWVYKLRRLEDEYRIATI